MKIQIKTGLLDPTEVPSPSREPQVLEEGTLTVEKQWPDSRVYLSFGNLKFIVNGRELRVAIEALEKTL